MRDEQDKAKALLTLREKYRGMAEGDSEEAKASAADSRLDDELGPMWRVIVELPSGEAPVPVEKPRGSCGHSGAGGDPRDDLTQMLDSVGAGLDDHGESDARTREEPESHARLLDQIRKLLG